jgi:hypothetical protein
MLRSVFRPLSAARPVYVAGWARTFASGSSLSKQDVEDRILKLLKGNSKVNVAKVSYQAASGGGSTLARGDQPRTKRITVPARGESVPRRRQSHPRGPLW